MCDGMRLVHQGPQQPRRPEPTQQEAAAALDHIENAGNGSAEDQDDLEDARPRCRSCHEPLTAGDVVKKLGLCATCTDKAAAAGAHA